MPKLEIPDQLYRLLLSESKRRGITIDELLKKLVKKGN
jgi:hypothetical protein